MVSLSLVKRFYDRDFPGGAVVKNPPANAGDMVRSLVWEDPTCRGATKPMSHNYWAHVPQLLKSARLEPVLCNKRSHHNEKNTHHNEEQPPLAATRESPCAETKTQCSQKLINFKKRFYDRELPLHILTISVIHSTTIYRAPIIYQVLY